MEHMRTIDIYTAFDRMLILCTRMDFCGLYFSGNTYILSTSNSASDFNEYTAPGALVARIIFGKLYIGEVKEDIRTEMQFRARRYNENLSHN